jgi:hypothetical protein
VITVTNSYSRPLTLPTFWPELLIRTKPHIAALLDSRQDYLAL